MTHHDLPDPEFIRSAPESTALASLDFGLALATTALGLEHPTLGAERICPRRCHLERSFWRSSSSSAVPSSALIAHYNAAVDDALGLLDDSLIR